MTKANILIADDNPQIRRACENMLGMRGYQVYQAATTEETLQAVRENDIDLVLLDLKLHERETEGFEVLKRMKAEDELLQVIILTAYNTTINAVKAIKLGAYDFLEKPPNPDRMLVTVENSLRQRRLLVENMELRNGPKESIEIIGRNRNIKLLKQKILKAAQSDANVIIYGESGTGKELVARNIHHFSKLADKPFVVVNCSAIPGELIESELFGHVKGAFTGATQSQKGKFEQANGGTLFLDEIGDMSLKAQPKVFRALQNGEIQPVGSDKVIHVNVRVIAATNKNLKEEIEKGRFREELYYRLNVVSLTVPPLRERKDDIPILAEHFLKLCSGKHRKPPKSLSEEAIKQLVEYSWPGNVRELRNLLEKLVVLSSSEIIDPWVLDLYWEDHEARILTEEQHFVALPLKQARDEFERSYIIKALRKNRGNISKTAQQLQINRSHLHDKMRQLKIDI
ncbi:MAG: sigma-54-dependent transcriptional regulator [Candidatus Heimdallarchaeota archaeon]